MSWYSLTVRRFIYVFIYWLWFTHAVPPIAVPPIPRPSDEQFIDYTKEGNTDQVTEALRYYPDLIDVQDKVGDYDIVMLPAIVSCDLPSAKDPK